MLNNINKPLTQAFALIQNEVANTAECSTKEMEIAHMVAGGKERIYLNQLATRLTGNIIDRVTDNVVAEEEITVYPEGTRPRKQSLNASVYMVASYSVLMSGYTSADILDTALINWLDEDQVSIENIDTRSIANNIIARFIADGILSAEDDEGQMETGERFRGHPATQEIQELRIETMQQMWDNAQPKMKPMLHKVTWNVNGTCEIPNLRLGIQVKQHFIDALNRMGHTGYKVNGAIRAQIKRKLKKGQYDKDQVQAMKQMLKLDPSKTYYFPHTPDYRGRVYARGGLTTFQGVKDIRAAFDFANHTTVDEDGLFLHIANACFDDKASIEERIQTVRNSHMQLMETPFKSLYAERARLAYVEYKETGLTNVICRIDGTCSGVQITSGLFLDAETGAAVNVGASLPTDKPQDLYGLVAAAALALRGKASDKTMIKKYGRDLTKKMIMILAYGAGEDTLIDSIKEFLTENNERTSNAKAIYKIVMQAIETKYPAITKLNEHLQIELECQPLNKLVYKLSDMTVKFKPMNSEHLNLYGTSYTAKLVGKAKADSDALARGIAPNFVHSLDSELLRKAVNKVSCDVSCIHDDMGVPSNQVKTALQALRTSYVEVIKAEPLKELYSAMGIIEEYEPEDNGLDLNDVLESSYLFS